MSKLTKGMALGAVLVAVVGGGYAAWLALPQGELDREGAQKQLAKLSSKVDRVEAFVTRRDLGDDVGTGSLIEILPAVDEFPIVVRPVAGANRDAVEIFVSTEKSGTGTDGWMTEVATAFNERRMSTSSGRPAQVAIRKMPSGTGYQYIAANKYRPHAFSPSNHLWISMAQEYGVTMTPVRERLVGNVAGIVMKDSAAEAVTEQYGGLEVRNIIDAVVQGRLAMGYTNPFASSTGLNFLTTVLATFSEGDEGAMLSPAVISAFEQFQRGVPFVALTTLQMRDSVTKNGSLDAFVMEYQTYIKTPELGSGYRFVAFGIRHDNPLYAVGEIDADAREVLEMLAEFAESAENERLANRYGFNESLNHASSYEVPAGDTLVKAQATWKAKKDSGRPRVAVFLTDVSGSMRGNRLLQVKRALLKGAELINDGNSIGLVTFSDRTTVLLPVKPFDDEHKSLFRAAVKDMDAAGKTAMYDGIVTSLSLLDEATRTNPQAQPILFVLTDGETNRGLEFAEVDKMVEGLNVPVYTIGYEANLAELGRLSSLVEAASINAGEGEIEFKIASLLNAQM